MFVAHDTIEPSKEWQDEIESALRTCQALCALLTPDFVGSKWCDQEVGFAVSRRVAVVPLKLKDNPHGFIGKYQAVTVGSGSHTWEVAGQVFDALAKNRLTFEAMVPSIIRRYEKINSFDNTRAAFSLIQNIPAALWSQPMVEQVRRAATENNQVEHAYLIGGRSIPEAVDELISTIEGLEEASATSQDDDTPF